MSSFLSSDRQLITWILYLIAIYLTVPAAPREDEEMLNVSRPGILVCVLLFGLVSFQSSQQLPYLWLYTLLLVAIGMAAANKFTARHANQGIAAGAGLSGSSQENY